MLDYILHLHGIWLWTRYYIHEEHSTCPSLSDRCQIYFGQILSIIWQSHYVVRLAVYSLTITANSTFYDTFRVVNSAIHFWHLQNMYYFEHACQIMHYDVAHLDWSIHVLTYRSSTYLMQTWCNKIEISPTPLSDILSAHLSVHDLDNFQIVFSTDRWFFFLQCNDHQAQPPWLYKEFISCCSSLRRISTTFSSQSDLDLEQLVSTHSRRLQAFVTVNAYSHNEQDVLHPCSPCPQYCCILSKWRTLPSAPSLFDRCPFYLGRIPRPFWNAYTLHLWFEIYWSSRFCSTGVNLFGTTTITTAIYSHRWLFYLNVISFCAIHYDLQRIYLLV